jgi:hypothetical protein
MRCVFAFSVDLSDVPKRPKHSRTTKPKDQPSLPYRSSDQAMDTSNKRGSRDRGSSSFTALHRTELRSTRRKYDSCPLGLHIRHTCHLWSASFLDVVARGNAFSDKLPHEDPNFERDGNFSYLSEMFPRISFTRFPIA